MPGRIVASFNVKSDTTRIVSRLESNQELDPSKDYYLSLISFSFSNVFQNLTVEKETNFIIILDVEGVPTVFETTDKIQPGIYEIDDILNIMNKLLFVNKYIPTADPEHYLAEFTLDLAIARIVLKPNPVILAQYKGYVGFQNEIPRSIFNTHFLELIHPNIIFDYEHPENYQDWTSVRMPKVATFNSFSLRSNLIDFPSFVQNEDGILTRKNQLYSFPSNVRRFQFKNFTAVQPLLYSLSSGGTSIDRIELELTEDNGTPLVVDRNNSTDLAAYFHLKEY